jgi:hypothetical protein
MPACDYEHQVQARTNSSQQTLSKVAPLTEFYADNFEVAESSPSVLVLSTALSEDMTHVSKWASDKNLTIAPNKSSVTLFTPDRAQTQSHPQAFLDSVLNPLNKNPKILGSRLIDAEAVTKAVCDTGPNEFLGAWPLHKLIPPKPNFPASPGVFICGLT